MAVATRLGYDDLPALLTRLTGDEKHEPSAFSTLDVLWVLYDRVLQVDPARLDDPDRDRFLLSRARPGGVLRRAGGEGLLPGGAAGGFRRVRLAARPSPRPAARSGVEISSGSLGHGLGLAVGVALRSTFRSVTSRVSSACSATPNRGGQQLRGDSARRRLALGRLTAVVIDNRSSSYGWPGGIGRRFRLEGWSALAVDGRDTTTSKPRSWLRRAIARTSSWPRSENENDHARALPRRRRRRTRPRPERSRTRRDRRRAAAIARGGTPPPPARHQRRHSRAADDLRRRWTRARGFRPVVESVPLAERPFEQIKLALGHQNVGAVLVSIAASYDAAEEGRTHQAPEDVALIATLPGWTIHVPGHRDEVERHSGGRSRPTTASTSVSPTSRMSLRCSPTASRFSAEEPTTRRSWWRWGRRSTRLSRRPPSSMPRCVPLHGPPVRRHRASRALRGTDVVLVEPYLAGTSASAVTDALRDRPHRLLSLGVRNAELRGGTATSTARRTDTAGIRASLDEFRAEIRAQYAGSPGDRVTASATRPSARIPATAPT